MANKKMVGNVTIVRFAKLAFKDHIYNAYCKNTNKKIYIFLRESVGINVTARLLKISKTTVLSRVLKMSNRIRIPKINENDQYY